MKTNQIPIVSLGKALKKGDKHNKGRAKQVFQSSSEDIALLIVGAIKEGFDSENDDKRKEARTLAVSFKDQLFQKLPVAEPEEESKAEISPELIAMFNNHLEQNGRTRNKEEGLDAHDQLPGAVSTEINPRAIH